jgi:hypothetical protein
MTTPIGEELIPDVLPEQRRATDLVKHIRKLRWVGMEQEAARLQKALAFFPPNERAIVLTRARNTN